MYPCEIRGQKQMYSQNFDFNTEPSLRGLLLRLGLQEDTSCVAAYVIPNFFDRNVPSGCFVPLPFLSTYLGNLPVPNSLPVLPVFSGAVKSWHVLKNGSNLFSGNRRPVCCFVFHAFLLEIKCVTARKRRRNPTNASASDDLLRRG